MRRANHCRQAKADTQRDACRPSACCSTGCCSMARCSTASEWVVDHALTWRLFTSARHNAPGASHARSQDASRGRPGQARGQVGQYPGRRVRQRRNRTRARRQAWCQEHQAGNCDWPFKGTPRWRGCQTVQERVQEHQEEGGAGQQGGKENHRQDGKEDRQQNDQEDGEKGHQESHQEDDETGGQESHQEDLAHAVGRRQEGLEDRQQEDHCQAGCRHPGVVAPGQECSGQAQFQQPLGSGQKGRQDQGAWRAQGGRQESGGDAEAVGEQARADRFCCHFVRPDERAGRLATRTVPRPKLLEGEPAPCP